MFKERIAEMTLEQKVGQLFLLAFPGKDAGLIRDLVQKFGICGSYISQDNAETFAEAQALSALLQGMLAQGKPASSTHSKSAESTTAHSTTGRRSLPLLLGVDQEGAWGVLVPESHTGPGNLALGALTNLELITDVYRMFGEEMLQAGYNALLSPCADTNSNPRSPIIGTRSFGDNYEHVANCVRAAVRGAKQSGILCTIKHFPGHGSTEGDTHREIPFVDKSLETLLAEDLKPFIAGIEAGADIIMTSHIRYPQIDATYPATLSSAILGDLVRKRLGFRGVILSDSMNMGAIRRNYDPAESTLQALRAGVDIVMLSEEHYDHDPQYLKKQIASLELVCQAVRSGNINVSIVEEKLERILALKQKIAQNISPKPKLPALDYLKLERQVARQCISLIADHWGLYPIAINEGCACINATPLSAYSNIMNPRGIGPNQSKPAFESFWETLRQGAQSAHALQQKAGTHSATQGAGIPHKFEHIDVVQNITVLENFHTLIIVTEDYPLPGEDMDKARQQELVRACLSRFGEKCLVIALRSPYELPQYPHEISYLCAYSSRTCSAVAVAELLLSAEMPNGKNHITISGSSQNSKK